MPLVRLFEPCWPSRDPQWNSSRADREELLVVELDRRGQQPLLAEAEQGQVLARLRVAVASTSALSIILPTLRVSS